MAGYSELARQLVHIFAGSFALLLRWTTWWQAALLAVAAVIFNLAVLPLLARRVFRPGDLDRILRSGIAIYPLSVLTLILCFPHRPDIAAVSWVVLAVGDGLATLVGAHVRTAPLPWNREKSIGGLCAFVLGAALAATAIASWTAKGMTVPPPWWFLAAAPAIAALIAGLVETVPIGADDNITVPFTAALVLWSLSHLDGAAMHAARPLIVARLIPALAVNIVFAFVGWRARDGLDHNAAGSPSQGVARHRRGTRRTSQPGQCDCQHRARRMGDHVVSRHA